MSLLLLALTAPALVFRAPGAVLRPTEALTPPMRLARTARAAVRMQEGGEREREGSRGRTAVVQRPKAEPKQMSKEDIAHEPMWRLLLHNDDVHTWDYVIFAIVSVVKTVSRKKAHRITTTVHTMGSATVTITFKQQAKKYCLEMQKWGLTSSIAPESSGPSGPGDNPDPSQ
jgi:ATP-dependent Clp protease adapter protein ClpS